MPLVDARLEDRLAHLLRARSANAALGRVELEAGGLEVEAANIQNPPHFALQILDHLLVR